MSCNPIVYILPGPRTTTFLFLALILGLGAFACWKIFGGFGFWELAACFSLSFITVSVFMWLLTLWVGRRRS